MGLAMELKYDHQKSMSQVDLEHERLVAEVPEITKKDILQRYLFFVDDYPTYPCEHGTASHLAASANNERQGLLDSPGSCEHSCASPEQLAFAKAHSLMSRLIRYFEVLIQAPGRIRLLVFLLEGLWREAVETEVTNISLNFLAASGTHEPDLKIPNERVAIERRQKQLHHASVNVLPGYVVQSPPNFDAVCWGLKLDRHRIPHELDLQWHGVLQMKLSDLDPVLMELASELWEWDGLEDDVVNRPKSYRKRINELIQRLEASAAFQKQPLWWNQIPGVVDL
ncbi:unnamed protein product, partial [Mesorhabditis spiculigera]